MKKQKWSGRTFSSLCSLISFGMLAVTGLVLFVQPHGRVAYWTQWEFLGLEKDQWGNLHLWSGFLFLIAGGFHLAYNWKPLVTYFTAKVQRALRYRRELALSFAVLAWLLVSGIWSLPPLITLSEFGESLKNAWITTPELEPPFGHAEELSLSVFCEKQRIPLQGAIDALETAGFPVAGANQSLAEIAAVKHASGMDVYRVIRPLEVPPEAPSTWTSAEVERSFAGTGIGRKTLAQIIEDHDLDPEVVRQRLEESGIPAKADDTIKDLAARHDQTPLAILNLILVGPQPESPSNATPTQKQKPEN